jgi:hypothetical protein
MGSQRDMHKIERLYYQYDYENRKKLKNAFKQFVRMSVSMERGDTDIASIFMDLKTVLGCYPLDSFEVRYLLTRYQRSSILYYLVRDLPLRDCALLIGTSMSTVSRSVDSGLERIFKHLNSALENQWRCWGNSDIEFVLHNYEHMGVEYCAKSLKRVTSDVERVVFEMKKKPEKYKFQQEI